MADANTQPADPRNSLGRLDSRVGMALAFWAYPQLNLEEAKKTADYPEPWKHAEIGMEIPADWPVAQKDANGRLTQGSSQGWNTQYNQDGKLENQFMVSINTKTREITFDFKGSDAWSNWVSDLANAGASEFAKIQEQAQKAFDQLSQDERFKDYRFAATGHSLGGGMAQSFALQNDMDAYVYNSLPIARDTIKGDYFKALGGFDAAIARYKSTGHQMHDVRTPNDIATINYDALMQNQYLSHFEGPGPTMLPGASLPVPIKTVFMASGYGTLPATAVMGKDHTVGAMFNAQHGLAIDPLGHYRIPEGHVDFAQLSPETRKHLAQLSDSPVTGTFKQNSRNLSQPYDRFVVTREDNSVAYVLVNTATGTVEIEHYNQDGKRTTMEVNERRRQSAALTGYDADRRMPVETTVHTAKSASEIISARIAENLAKDPDFLNRMASLLQSGVQDDAGRTV